MTEHTPIKTKNAQATGGQMPRPADAAMNRPEAAPKTAPPPAGRMAGNHPDSAPEPTAPTAQAASSSAAEAATDREDVKSPAPAPEPPATTAQTASSTSAETEIATGSKDSTSPVAAPEPPAAATKTTSAAAAEATEGDSELDDAFAELAQGLYITRPAKVKDFLAENRDLLDPLARVIPKLLACRKVSRIGLSLLDRPGCYQWCLLVRVKIDITNFIKRVEERGRIRAEIFRPVVGNVHSRLRLAFLHAWGRRAPPDTGSLAPVPEDDSAFEAAFAALAAQYHITEPKTVKDYLDSNRDLLPVLPRILAQVLAQPEIVKVHLDLFEGHEFEMENEDDELDSNLYLRAKTNVFREERWTDIGWEIDGDIIRPVLGENDDRLVVDLYKRDPPI